MIQNASHGVGAKKGRAIKPFVLLLGPSLQFSDQMIRVLKYEFPDVRFDRTSDAEALSSVSSSPTVVVLHESLPDIGSWIDSTGTTFPDATIAVACADAGEFQRTLRSKSLPPVCLLQLNTPIDVWLSVLRLLLCGHVYLPIEAFGVQHAPDGGGGTKDGAIHDAVTAAHLTPREMQILGLIAQGKQNKTIAAELSLSEHTVKLHTHNIFSKLEVPNRTGAAKWYFSHVEASPPAG